MLIIDDRWFHQGIRDIAVEEHKGFVLEADTNSIGYLLGVIKVHKSSRSCKIISDYQRDIKDQSRIECG
jgi:hypothetical protein